jgi:hypothetical protein
MRWHQAKSKGGSAVALPPYLSFFSWPLWPNVHRFRFGFLVGKRTIPPSKFLILTSESSFEHLTKRTIGNGQTDIEQSTIIHRSINRIEYLTIAHRSSNQTNGHRSLDIGHRSLDMGTSDIGHRTSNIEHRTSNIEHRTSNIEHRTSNFGHRTSSFGHRTSSFELRTSDFELISTSD